MNMHPIKYQLWKHKANCTSKRNEETGNNRTFYSHKSKPVVLHICSNSVYSRERKKVLHDKVKVTV